ncbi:hydantoinase B/oxoprolinase family protein [Natrarchaeobius chitinivorans]|uniref:Hydantoinase B/oxoprolinase family protein n=1 Tax=Natrarchaeobius chitinivorans TaxID=1679083 RepID=A0A3N6LWB9_NATCH|nr:hydantoinase B/oxoprolinase family protein [Natrarchaeobius chitinivorans]RQG94913.1 hydantoinase B/oxoprolinase family protein [Natrarchaeobius chitinivorans]
MTETDVDPATVEVIRNYLTSAASEMQRTLIRTAYNTIIYEIKDFGLSLYDADLNLVADSPGLTLFLGANDYSLEKGVEHVGEDNFEEGDVVIMNYPYWSSGHTLDVCVIMPIFVASELKGYAVSRAHLLDMGQKDPGYVLDSTDVHQEGLLFPGTKLYEAGELDEEIRDLLRFNTRVPDKVIGDINAQVAALRTGTKRFQELYERYGSETVEASIDRILEYGEQSAHDAVEELPDGTWSAVDYADGAVDDDELLRIETTVTIDGDEMIVDFAGSSDQIDAPFNVPIGMTRTVARLCLKTITTPDEESNAGHYAPLTVEVPEDNLYNPSYPAPTFAVWPAMLAVDVVYKALAKGMPERIPASSGGDILSVTIYGEHPETGKQIVEATNQGVGWGATAERDGESALMHISETMVQNIPIEVLENKAPVEIDRLSLRQDSGGPGRNRGGLGIRRDFRFTDEIGALSIIQKTETDGWGLDGGKPGAKNAVVLYPGTDRERRTGMMRETFQPGEALSNQSAGGGGYGDPYERDPERVLADVVDGYVSREGAREEYGVVVTEELEIDRDATKARRE